MNTLLFASFFTSLPFILILAFLIIIIGIGWIVETKSRGDNRIEAVRIAKMSDSDYREMKSFIAATNETPNVSVYRYNLSASYEYLQQCLIHSFGERLSILSQECNIPQHEGEIPKCTTIFGIKTKDGLIAIQLSPYRWDYKKDKKPHFKLKNGEDLEDFLSGPNKLDGCMGIKIAMPSAITLSHPDIMKIDNYIKLSEIEVIEYPEEREESDVSYYSLVKTTNRYALQREHRTIRPITKELLSLSYNKVGVEYEGEKVQVPMGEAMNLIQATLEEKENVCMFGIPGSGKSYLSDEIARRSGRKNSTAVIFISPAMVEELQRVEMLPELRSELENLKMFEGKTPVFFIDEAEKLLQKTDDGIHSITNSFMLSMLDGQIQKLFDCACVLTFNCKKSELNQAAFRTGRMGLEIELNELEPAQSTDLAIYLQETNPTLIFDKAHWAKFDGKNIVLAEIYGCFSSPTKQRVIGNMIRAMKGEKPLPRVPAIPQAVSRAEKIITRDDKLAMPSAPLPPSRFTERPHLVEDLQTVAHESTQSNQTGNRNKHRRHRRR